MKHPDVLGVTRRIDPIIKVKLKCFLYKFKESKCLHLDVIHESE